MNFSNCKNGVNYEENQSSGNISPCYENLLNNDIFETCIPDFDDYCYLLSKIAIEVKYQ